MVGSARYWVVEVAPVVVATIEVAVDDVSSVGTIEGAAAGSMMTVRVEVEVRRFWSPACAGRVAT
ncbi:MAG: hypothetical protein ABR881_32310 [Candidatus Sulfotelmatobacter sp.]